jgi:hypothetical protein
MLYDDARNILELNWYKGTEFITVDDYMWINSLDP